MSKNPYNTCLLYTSDAADDLLCVDLGGRRIIKKKNTKNINKSRYTLREHTQQHKLTNISSITKHKHSNNYDID